MASPASPEASDIRRRGRQRLIGAIAIAVLLVVFVPMILDSEPRSARNAPALEIPAKENVAALPPPTPAPTVPTAPAAPAAAVQTAPPAEPPSAPGVPPQQQAPAAPATAPVVSATPAPAAKAAEPRLEGFAVQVGAFRDEEKLKQARDKLAAAGIKHYVERRATQSGELTRLRAGPFATRAAAEKGLAAVKAATLDGKVVALP
jgi:DedD protein